MTQSSPPSTWITGSGGGGGGGVAHTGSLLNSNGASYVPTSGFWSAAASSVGTTTGPAKEMQMPADGDIKFGNVSLKDFMETVSRRLAMLTPNPKLEAEWDELRTLGEAYRALEKDLTEKSQTWDILKRT